MAKTDKIDPKQTYQVKVLKVVQIGVQTLRPMHQRVHVKGEYIVANPDAFEVVR